VQGTKDRSWPRAFIALLLACLLVQATAVQSHIHFIRQASSIATLSDGGSAQLAKAGKGGEATDCLLCQESAVAGACLLPQAALLLPPPANALWISIAAIRKFALSAPARGWLSRAPPQEL
jgi:hypothetical protein